MISELRHALLCLHKALVDSIREQEETASRLKFTPHQWWHMLSNDERFQWLRPFTRLIVAMDEALEQPEPDRSALELLRDEARSLMKQVSGTLPYQAALQHSPDATMAHADVLAQLGKQTGADGGKPSSTGS